MAAGLARFHADVRKVRGRINRQLLPVLFAACGAQEAAEFPFREAEPAQQRAPSTVALGTQNRDDRLLGAERASALHGGGVYFALRGLPLDIRLLDDANEERVHQVVAGREGGGALL